MEDEFFIELLKQQVVDLRMAGYTVEELSLAVHEALEVDLMNCLEEGEYVIQGDCNG